MNQLNLYPYRSSAFFFNGSVGLDESLVSALCHHNQAEPSRRSQPALSLYVRRPVWIRSFGLRSLPAHSAGG